VQENENNENNKNNKNNQNSNIFDNAGNTVKKPPESMLRPALALGIITFVTVLILAVSNSLASPVIEKRLQDEKEASVINLFGEGIFSEELFGFEDLYLKFKAPVTEVLTVRRNSTNEIAGYCATVVPKGYIGPITMLVAINPDATVKDTAVLSMTETAGSGSKIGAEQWFHDQFKDKNVEYLPDVSYIDVIAHATVSSKAFFNGVTSALSVVKEIIAEENFNTYNNSRNNRNIENENENDENNINSEESNESENMAEN